MQTATWETQAKMYFKRNLKANPDSCSRCFELHLVPLKIGGLRMGIGNWQKSGLFVCPFLKMLHLTSRMYFLESITQLNSHYNNPSPQKRKKETTIL